MAESKHRLSFIEQELDHASSLSSHKTDMGFCGCGGAVLL